MISRWWPAIASAAAIHHVEVVTLLAALRLHDQIAARICPWKARRDVGVNLATPEH
jgi:hypothetical protein